MQNKKPKKEINLILYSLSGMVLGIIVFLFTENFIFLIVFSAIGLTLGIAASETNRDSSSDDQQEG